MATQVKKRKSVLKSIEPFLYLAPAIVFFVTFTYYPFIKTVGSSFFLLNSMGQAREFVGLENYINVLQDARFIAAIKNTLLYVVLTSPGSILIALLLALIANKKTRSSSIYETLFSLTMAMSMSVSAMIFKLAYNPTIGIVNYLLGTNINWLNDSRYAMVAVSMVMVWMSIGYNFIFLVAGIRNIPEELIESANLDGANQFHKVTKIVLPMISPTLFFLITTSLAKNLMMSGLVIVFSTSAGLGTTASIDTMISYMYKQAVNSLNYNNAYAAAIIAFLLTFGLIVLVFRFEKKGVHYS